MFSVQIALIVIIGSCKGFSNFVVSWPFQKIIKILQPYTFTNCNETNFFSNALKLLKVEAGEMFYKSYSFAFYSQLFKFGM